MIEVHVLEPDDGRLWRRLRLAALAQSPAAFGTTLGQWTDAGDTEERWHARDDDMAELMLMWVAPFARGRGIGDGGAHGLELGGPPAAGVRVVPSSR